MRHYHVKKRSELKEERRREKTREGLANLFRLSYLTDKLIGLLTFLWDSFMNL